MSARYLHIFLILASLTSSASRADLTPALDSAYTAAGPENRLPVLIAFRGLDLGSLHEQLFGHRPATLPVRHRVLIDSLQARASIAQTEIANSLAILEKNGMITNRRPLWIGNLLAAEVNRAGAELIADLAAVEEVGLDVDVTLVMPFDVAPSEPALLHLESALREVGAQQAWTSGVTGEGTTIAVLGPSLKHVNPLIASRQQSFTTPNIGSSNSVLDANIPLGCMLALDADRGDTLGLAYAANWIAAETSPRNLSDALLLLQSYMDPDQNSATFDDAPDVILHAWEAEMNCQSAAPAAAWNALANSELLGPISVFAAGEHGEEGRGILARPSAGAGANSPGFCVGNVDFNSGSAVIHSKSSRGPSPCNLRVVKPDLSAPGTSVRTLNTDGIISVSGSIVAASYVAATCALMRQVNPEIVASSAKIALQLSARDLGLPGEDNDFGFGMLDVAAAIEYARGSSETGSLSGSVRYGGQGIADARVYLTSEDGSFVARTDANGNFRIQQVLAGKKYAVHVTRFGFQDFSTPDSILVEVKRDFPVTVDLLPGLADDAEVDRGFALSVKGDNATSGVWTRSAPVASFQDGAPVQVADDVTPYGSFCFVTGNASSPSDPAGAADVDGGATTLRSPVFNLENISQATLRFHYAYSNNLGPQKGGDFFTAQISNDAGKTWTNLVRTSLSTNGWQEVSLDIEDFITPTDEMALQFIAEDNAPPSLVEAAVDEIRIEGKSDALEPPTNLQLTPQSDGVILNWNRARGAASYGVYMSSDVNRVYAPEFFLITVTDTFAYIPFSDIPYDQPYFQVVSQK